jgi:cellulose biosynthesis protein BcsQ
MIIPVITFFNNKGGVGKTSLVYHLSWMFSEMGRRVLALDLDPQANLTAGFLEEDQLESLWETQTGPTTIYKAVQPLTKVGDLAEPALATISSRLHLVPGDVALARFEEKLSQEWPNSLGNDPYRSFRVLTAFWQIGQLVAKRVNADIIFVDVGPNLGAINRSALIGSDYVVIPLGADLFSLQGLKNLGPTLRDWRMEWAQRMERASRMAPPLDFALPQAAMHPLGYIIQQHSVRLSRPVKAYDRWVNRVPGVYGESVLQQPGAATTPADDPHCLATLKHYRSLIPMAQEARKPIFKLTPADGAIGNHAVAVQEAVADFRVVAEKILSKMAQQPQSGGPQNSDQ